MRAVLVPGMVLVLPGCGGPIDGTWMFTRSITVATGEECTSGITHDFVGAYEPATIENDDAWTENDTAEVSSEVFFGRVDQDGDTAVLIVGASAYPGAKQDDGGWGFTWDHTASGRDNDTHESGYNYVYTYDTTTTTRVTGTFSGGSFNGAWEESSQAVLSWTESDSWSDEVAATIGTTGRVPASTYLLKLDTTGAEVAATNDYQATDCDVTGCLLTVTTACAYTYDLSGQRTGFTPDDARWVEDAGQTSGI